MVDHKTKSNHCKPPQPTESTQEHYNCSEPQAVLAQPNEWLAPITLPTAPCMPQITTHAPDMRPDMTQVPYVPHPIHQWTPIHKPRPLHAL
jgi:hypothetical protein